MSKRKKHTPSPALNPIIQAKKVGKQDLELQRLQAVLDTVINTELAKSLKGSVDNLNGIVDSFKQVVSCTHKKEFCLNELRIGLQTLIRASCLLNNIELIWKYDTDDKRFVKLPFQSLLQVLHNLVSNAIKALQTKE